MENNIAEWNAEAIATALLSSLEDSIEYPRRLLQALVNRALDSDQLEAEEASRAIFSTLVERLADSFDPAAVDKYNRLMSQLIAICRDRDQELDHALNHFSLDNEQAIYSRADNLRGTGSLPTSIRPSKVIVLSRVTLGADVAITSVIIEEIKKIYPDAEIFFLGSRKITELFGGDSRLTFEDISYGRTHTLLSRLHSWLDVLERIRSVTAGLGPMDYAIIDPDSRLTQLGILPLCNIQSGSSPYLFFPSREFNSSSAASISTLTSNWINSVFGGDGLTLPKIQLRQTDLDLGSNLIKGIRSNRMRPVVTLNFGTGGNPRKRIEGGFEKEIIQGLLRLGALVILDRGAGEEENRHIEGIIQIVRSGYTLAGSVSAGQVEIAECDEQTISHKAALRKFDPDILVWNGRIGLLAALIAGSDLYIGYDSAGQHIAAALGIPCIDVFSGFTSARMPERWKPAGSAEILQIIVEPAASISAITQSVLENASRILSLSE